MDGERAFTGGPEAGLFHIVLDLGGGGELAEGQAEEELMILAGGDAEGATAGDGLGAFGKPVGGEGVGEACALQVGRELAHGFFIEETNEEVVTGIEHGFLEVDGAGGAGNVAVRDRAAVRQGNAAFFQSDPSENDFEGGGHADGAVGEFFRPLDVVVPSAIGFMDGVQSEQRR